MKITNEISMDYLMKKKENKIKKMHVISSQINC